MSLGLRWHVQFDRKWQILMDGGAMSLRPRWHAQCQRVSFYVRANEIKRNIQTRTWHRYPFTRHSRPWQDREISPTTCVIKDAATQKALGTAPLATQGMSAADRQMSIGNKVRGVFDL